MRTLSSSLTSSSATRTTRAGKVLSALMKMETFPGEKRSTTPQSSRERERARFAVVFVLVLNVSLSSVLSFRSLSQRNENNFVSLSLSSLFCQTLREKREHEREREKGDCVGIPPWCWKSGFDEDFKGDETKERRGDVDHDDVRDAPSFLVVALVFVRSRDSTDG